MIKEKRGISPVIAAVLLILIVVVLAVIIFFAFRGFIGEETLKFGSPIADACDDVDLEVGYASGEVSINNQGDVPVYEVKITNSDGGFECEEEIKLADNIALMTEMRDVMAKPPVKWNEDGLYKPHSERIIPLGPDEAEQLFIKRYNELRKK